MMDSSLCFASVDIGSKHSAFVFGYVFENKGWIYD